MLGIVLNLKLYFTENKTKALKINFLNTCVIVFLSLGPLVLAQSATVQGVLLDETNTPIENVNIAYDNNGVSSNINGFYSIEIPSDQEVVLQFSHVNYKKIQVPFRLKPNESVEFNPVLKI